MKRKYAIHYDANRHSIERMLYLTYLENQHPFH